MNTIKLFFDYIGHAITSLAAVIFVMLMTITGMILFSHTLFAQVFPVGMQHWEKIAATWLMALGWEFTVLITTCNTRHINKQIPAIMAICSGIIVLFFIQAFDGEQTALTLVQRWFVGVLAATINYIYAELFYKKWMERKNSIEMPLRVNELQSTVNELQSTINELQSTINELQRKCNEVESLRTREALNYEQSKIELNELQRFKNNIQSELTCPHCKVVQVNFGTLHAHKGHCNSNPRNKKSND